MKMKREVAIVHFNTPELTRAAILSLRKHGGEDYHVTVFDNSDKRPFLMDGEDRAGSPGQWTKGGGTAEREPGGEAPGTAAGTMADGMTSGGTMEEIWKADIGDVTVVDNTRGQVIDFEKELEKYPERDEKYGCAQGCVFGSDKHMMSVQKLWEILPDGFLLMDSDILVRKDIDFMFMEDQCACGHVAKCSGPVSHERLAPMLLWINVRLCVERGARFFDPDRAWALHKGWQDKRNFWDTGAALLADIRTHRNGLNGKRVDIRPLMYHLGSGSWAKNDETVQQRWLEEHRELWEPAGEPRGEARGTAAGAGLEAPDNGRKMAAGEEKKKYTVLTYVFGGYEIVQEVVEKDPDAEYVLVTDDKSLKSRTWTVVCDETMRGWPVMEKCYYVRFHPFEWANTDVVVRIDGSIEVRKPLGEMVKALEDGGYDRCVMVHPTRGNFEEELDCWIRTRHYRKDVAERCLKMMAGFGYKMSTKGMVQGCFEIVKKTKENEEANRLIYYLMKYTGGEEIDRLDQHVTTFVLATQWKKTMKLMYVDESIITDGRLMQWYLHKTKRAIPMKKDTIAPMMFGRSVKIWRPKENTVNP